MSRLPIARFVAAPLLLLLVAGSTLVGGAGCAAHAGAEPSYPEAEPAPPYDARAAQLFDDSIDPAAVGLAPFAPSPKGDPIFRERVNRAETVVRVRVTTVTADAIDGVPTYHIGLAALDRRLAGRDLPADRLEITIPPNSPAFGIARSLDAQLIGRKFVGFFRRFARGGEAPLFFHLAADSPDVLAAVHEATLLGELSGH